MISSNLKWVGSVEILIGDVCLDLHNCYDLVSFQHHVRNQELKLNWRRGKGDWIDPSLPSQVTICFHKVFYLEIEPRDLRISHSEDDCLETFGFYSDSDHKKNEDFFFVETAIDPKWLWSFVFQSRAEIIVGAQSVAGILVG